MELTEPQCSGVLKLNLKMLTSKRIIKIRDAGTTVGHGGAVKELWQWKLIWNKNRFINYVCFCSSATLTSQITTEIIETILNFLRALIAAINFSISILINRVITYDTWKNWFKRRRRPMILLWKGTSTTQPFLLKDKGQCPVMPPFFVVPDQSLDQYRR